MERQPGEELKMAWVPTDQGDGIWREADDDKRGPHDNGTARERRWAKRYQLGAQASFPTVCTCWRDELACHVVKNPKHAQDKSIIVILKMTNGEVTLVKMSNI